MKATRTYEEYHPQSIIPANGWRAVYVLREEDGKAIPDTEPLVCFALAEEVTVTVFNERTEEREKCAAIVGYVATDYGIIEAAPECNNFIGYVGPDDDLAMWENRINESKRLQGLA